HLVGDPLSDRRAALERFMKKAAGSRLLLSPATTDRQEAERWLAASGGALDGIVAKRRDEPYRPGERAMVKVKQQRTADCIVGGYRLSGDRVGSLLLGLYDAEGLLHYVGYTSSFSAAERETLLPLLEKLRAESAFTGSSPGG